MEKLISLRGEITGFNAHRNSEARVDVHVETPEPEDITVVIPGMVEGYGRHGLEISRGEETVSIPYSRLELHMPITITRTLDGKRPPTHQIDIANLTDNIQ